ncbi:hypothetical protein BH23ACI1_BH23ACI1_29910 [soil metagenome]
MTTFSLRIEPPVGPPLTRPLDGRPMVFGRSTEADVVCSDSSMSRRHAQVLGEAGSWFVEDLGARNGTFLNGVRIEGRERLVIGDVVKMGATLVRLVDPAAPASGPASPSRGSAGLGDERLGSTIFRPIEEILPGEVTAPDAPAVDPARLAARLKALNNFHRALGQVISLGALLDLLLDQLFAVLQPEEGVILLRQPDGSLKTAASRRQPGATGDLLVSQRLIEEVVTKNAAAIVTDIAFDERFAMAQSMVAAGVRGILAAPFTDAEGCVGMVAVYSRTRIRRFSEEDLELLVSLASAAALRIRNVGLAEEAAARRVQDRELTLASEIQMGMLPGAMPARPEIDLAARLIPARAVGGDLYDFLVLGEAVWFIVADAAGKGVSAALFMAVTRTLFRAIARDDITVSTVIERMNAELARDNDRQVFVTALVGRLSLDTGELVCCNAGHHPIHRIAGDGSVQPLAGDCGGIALGILEDATYQEARATIEPGDTLLLFTDGVTEAINGSGELFSDARLLHALDSCAGRPAAAIVDRILEAVNAFADGTPQEDDITLMALRYRA